MGRILYLAVRMQGHKEIQMEETDLDTFTENISGCPHRSLVVVCIRAFFLHWLANVWNNSAVY